MTLFYYFSLNLSLQIAQVLVYALFDSSKEMTETNHVLFLFFFRSDECNRKNAILNTTNSDKLISWQKPLIKYVFLNIIFCMRQNISISSLAAFSPCCYLVAVVLVNVLKLAKPDQRNRVKSRLTFLSTNHLGRTNGQFLSVNCTFKWHVILSRRLFWYFLRLILQL